MIQSSSETKPKNLKNRSTDPNNIFYAMFMKISEIAGNLGNWSNPRSSMMKTGRLIKKFLVAVSINNLETRQVDVLSLPLEINDRETILGLS